METPAAVAQPAPSTAVVEKTKYNHWLPYIAVFQTDLWQTMTSWVYRVWVITSVIAAVGYLMYRFGIYREAGIVQYASTLVGDLLRWTVLGSMALIAVLTVGAIAPERGTLADSVLSRGISRRQYFLAKWHARLFAILFTFWAMGAMILVACHYLLHEDLTIDGSLVALLGVSAVLMVVVTWGVTVSALTTSTLFGIAIAWVGLYAVNFVINFVPPNAFPERILSRLPHVVRGHYDTRSLLELLGASLLLTTAGATVGLTMFSRADV